MVAGWQTQPDGPSDLYHLASLDQGFAAPRIRPAGTGDPQHRRNHPGVFNWVHTRKWPQAWSRWARCPGPVARRSVRRRNKRGKFSFRLVRWRQWTHAFQRCRLPIFQVSTENSPFFRAGARNQGESFIRTRCMPHFGQSPGALETTSGCMGQTNTGAALVLVAGVAACVVLVSWPRQPLVRNKVALATTTASSGTINFSLFMDYFCIK